MLAWSPGFSIGSFISNVFGHNNGGGSVIISNGGITVMTNMCTVTEEECNTEHIIACRYDNLSTVTSQGAIKTSVKVPLSNSHDCTVNANGSGEIVFTEKQSFTKLSLNLDGSGSITLATPPTTINRLFVVLNGSGDISIDEEADIHNASVTLTGSGDISLGDSTVDSLKCVLTGSGDIQDFVVLSEANFSLTGSGGIKGAAKKAARIKQIKVGSGNIRVNRCK